MRYIMQMSDVMKVLGDSTLREFPWGCVVRDTINVFARNEFRLTDDSTGLDVNRSLDSLGSDVKELVLKATVDTRQCSITQPVGGGMVVRHTSEQREDPTVELWRALASPKFIVVATIVSAVVLISLNMVFRLEGLSMSHLIDAILQVATEE